MHIVIRDYDVFRGNVLMHDFVIRDLPTTWAPSYDVFRGNVLMHDFVIRDLPTAWAPSYDV